MPKVNSKFSNDYLKKLPFGYRKALMKLEQEMTNNPQQMTNLIENFSYQYLMPTKLWEHWIWYV